MLREKRGITLIALVVTIIVLLILAAVSISAITGENGIATKAQKAKEQTANAQLEEELNLKLADMQIEMATEENPNLEELDLKGMYKYEFVYSGNAPRGEIDGIFETNSGLARATFVMNVDSDGNETYKFENVKSVSTVPDIAMPLYIMMMDEDSTEIEQVDFNDFGSYAIIGLKYKNVVYDICMNDTTGILLTISVREEFTAKTWKNVFASSMYTYGLDSNDKLWLLYEEDDGMCLNNVYPEFNEFVVKEAIYSYDGWGDKEILGFIGTNGKIYILNGRGSEVGSDANTDLLICLNDEFSSEFGGIKAEEVIPSTEMFGVIQVESLFTGTCLFNCVIRDVDGKIWIVEFNYDGGLVPHAICVNTELTDLNNIKFKQMVVCDINTSEEAFVPTTAEATYFTMLGLDNNNKLWKIQNTDWDYENGEAFDSYRLVAKNLVEKESFPLIKSIDYGTSWDEANIVDESGNVYRYEFCYSSERTSVILEGSNIKEYNDGWMLSDDGNVYEWETVINSDEFEGKMIKDIYEYRFVLAEDETIYSSDYNYPLGTADKELIKTSSSGWGCLWAIDSDNKLHMFVIPK